MNGIVYVSYSGYVGDCGIYHGWVVGVDINNPSNCWWLGRRQPWAAGSGDTAALPAMAPTCLWSRATPSTRAAIGWAAKRLSACKPGRSWTGQPTDYWAPTNWLSLDNTTPILGGVSATVVDVPGATPSQLVLALGKDSNAYLVDRNNLGGIASPVAQANVAGTNRGTSAVTYHTSQETYIAFITM